MTRKRLDLRGRWRNKTIAFRISPEENKLLERYVHLSGLTKQDYITSRMLERPITVNGNPRVYKALRDELAEVLEQLRKIEAGNQVDADLLAVISMIATVMDGIKGSDTILAKFGEMKKGPLLSHLLAQMKSSPP